MSKNDNEDLYQKSPSIFQMLKTFSKELATHVANGGTNVSSNDYAERLDACNKCPHLNKDKMRCGICGCLVQHKAKWQTTTCPDKPTRWKNQHYKSKKPNV